MIRLILDWRTPGNSTDYAPSAFRWAMSAQYALWTLGLIQIWRYRVKTRALLLAGDAEAKANMRNLA